jgi:hypothetical protein
MASQDESWFVYTGLFTEVLIFLQDHDFDLVGESLLTGWAMLKTVR